MGAGIVPSRSAGTGNEYQVAVLGVKLNATEEVVSNNMFNDPPRKEGMSSSTLQ